MQLKYAIVGARFRPPAQDILNVLPAGTPLMLVRQPENPYDARACAVMLDWADFPDTISQFGADLPNPLHLGFIPAKENAEISNKMDIEGKSLVGILTFSLAGGPMIELTNAD